MNTTQETEGVASPLTLCDGTCIYVVAIGMEMLVSIIDIHTYNTHIARW